MGTTLMYQRTPSTQLISLWYQPPCKLQMVPRDPQEDVNIFVTLK